MMSRRAIANAANLTAYGSFQDSLRSPVHRWFTYPAGYSHKLVESKIGQYELDGRHWIADPFATTQIRRTEMGQVR